MTAHPDIAENSADLESTCNQIPEGIAREIESWRRAIENAQGANARDLLSRAAVDLWHVSRVNRGVHPESTALVNQEVADTLNYLAEVARVDPDDAQFIFSLAKDEQQIDSGRHANGHNIIDEPPPPNGASSTVRCTS